MYLEQTELGTLRGKTGAVGIGVAPGAKATMGWLVGWLEHAGSRHIFAMNIDVREPKQLALRLPITKALLKRAFSVDLHSLPIQPRGRYANANCGNGMRLRTTSLPGGAPCAAAAGQAPRAGDAVAGGVADRGAGDGAHRAEDDQAGAAVPSAVLTARSWACAGAMKKTRGDGRGGNR